MKAALNPDIRVLGTGSYLPERVITNEVLRDLCTNYDEEQGGDFSTWVDRVTHIHERRFMADGETSAHMAQVAAERAMDMAGVKVSDLDLIIHCTFTPSASVPGDHALLADLLGAEATPCFTLTGACAGSVYGMAVAQGMIGAGFMRRVLVTGSETISPTLDFSDPLTAILFGDGAGAVVMGADKGGDGGMLPPDLGFEFNWDNIHMPNVNMTFMTKIREPGRNGCPPAVEKQYLKMIGGPSVLRNAVNTMADSVLKCLGYADGKPGESEMDEIRGRMRLIPHQANGRIVDGLVRKLGIEPIRSAKPIYRTGNISAASNVIALDYAMRRGNMVADREEETGKITAIHEVDDPIQRGDLVLVPSIGAGYVFGCVGFVNTIG